MGRSEVAGVSFRTVALLAAGLHVVLGLVLYEPILFPGGDNAGYMILGESLRTGAGYRDLYLPEAPIHTKYPPGYPLLLAGLGWLGGLQLFKLASLALTAATVWLTARLGRRLVGAAPAAAAALLLAVNPVLLEYGHWVLSEAPFTFLVLLSLFLVTGKGRAASASGGGGAEARGLVGPPGTVWGHPGVGARRFVPGVVAAVGAFLTRTAGLPLLLAVPAAEALARRWRRAAGSAAAGLAAMGGWAAFQRLGSAEQPGYLRELVLRNPYDPAAGAAEVGELVRRALTNLWTYLSEVLPSALTGRPPTEADELFALFGLLVGALAFTGWILRSLEALEAPELFLVLYAGLIAVWPEVWTDRRFLLPVLPLVLAYASLGAAWAVSRATGGLGGSRRRGAAAGAAGLILLLGWPAVATAVRLAPERIDCLAAHRRGTPCEAPAMASFYAAARWAGTEIEPDAVVANRKPRLFYWIARRKGDVYRYSPEPSLVLRSLEEMGADYVVVDQVSGTTARYLVPAIREFQDRFQLAYRGGGPPTLLLRFLPPPRTAGRP